MRSSFNFLTTSPEDLPQETRERLRDDVRSALTVRDEINWQTERLQAFAEQVIMKGSTQEASAAAEIVLKNQLHTNLVPEMLGSYGASDKYDKKQQLIGIAVAEPELAHSIVANSVGGFHASNSSSLLGVLEHGLLSSKDARDRDLALGSGERTYTNPKAPSFISFADWRDPEALQRYAGSEQRRSLELFQATNDKLYSAVDNLAEQWGDDYLFTINGRWQIEDNERIIEILTQEPTSLKAELIRANFPVLYGFDVSNYNRVHSNYFLDTTEPDPVIAECIARSSIRSEFALFNGSVHPSDIPIIAVPAHHVDNTRQLVQEAGHGIDVYPLDTLITRHRAQND